MEGSLKDAIDLVKAQASVRHMTEEEIISMLKSVSGELNNLFSGAQEAPEQEQQPSVDPKKAIREKTVVCLECGKTFKVLTKKHLATHGLTPDEYKEKWGFKKNQALIAKGLARERKKKMQEMQLWKKRKKA